MLVRAMEKHENEVQNSQKTKNVIIMLNKTDFVWPKIELVGRGVTRQNYFRNLRIFDSQFLFDCRLYIG